MSALARWVVPFLLSSCAVAAMLPGGPTIVAEGRSDYSVYYAPDAPPSVRFAAQEIQRVIKLATGVELPIRTTPGGKMICLGDSPVARQAGVTPVGLPDDGFRYRARPLDDNVLIVGKDYPNDQPPWRGWTSRGTLFGAFDFLERMGVVRWLMPGEVGEDINTNQLALGAPGEQPDQAPDFPNRFLADVQETRAAADPHRLDGREWMLHLKLPLAQEGRKLEHGHAWDDYVTQEQAAAHPEWLAKDEQGRPRKFARWSAVKFCTSNPELVQAFAEGVMKRLAAQPTFRGASISPSDGGDFCQCDQCRKLYTTDPNGRPSITPLILKFYNDVARIVSAKYPDRLLAGYVYYNYMYPPPEPVTLDEHVYLVWAPLNYYGRGLQKPIYREEFPKVAAGWLKVTPRFVYHNYSTWLRDFSGAPLPPALDILKLELPTLHRVGAVGADIVGLGAWGYGGLNNYLIAKQLWHADVDVDALAKEWLTRAYGPGAAPMKALLKLIDDRFRDWKANESPVYKGSMYEVNYELIDAVYRPVMGELERRYREAEGKCETDKQRQRLAMYGDNLVMLHHNMLKAGMSLPDPEHSPFYRTDEQYQQFLAEREFSPALYRNSNRRYIGPIWKGEWAGD